MVYLLLAIFGSAFLTIILKLFQLKGVNTSIGIAVNYIIAAILSFIFSPDLMSAREIMDAPWLVLVLVVGAMFMLSFLVYALSAQRVGVAITTVVGRAAMAIPVVFAFLVLGEQATMLKIGMLVLILVSLPLIIYRKSDARLMGNAESRTDVRYHMKLIILPLAVFLFNGTNDTMVQYVGKSMVRVDEDIASVTGVMFVGGALAGLLWCVGKSFIKEKCGRWRLKDIVWGSILGAVNWVCMTGVFAALTVMDGSLFYPLYYTGAILIATLAGIMFFGERLSWLNWCGIVIAVTAIVFIAA